ncbi:Crp/Fnr family transcriptional regulator [Altericroceibacterium xinjiangense]|uniref:Crp/Fnr family transcriptional regulator n=1 Tax=Altericroceibacterium xinjiangense TaxID=762261 RepID=UPI001F49AA73|nr:Crp/Fnr family transcriptional regulator [Altericroceibacterium xinjiangense]
MATSNMSALSLFLDRLLRRSVLSAEEQGAILNLRSHAFQAEGRSDIVSPGQKVDHACLVVDGLVGRFDQMAADGRRQTTAFHLPGDMCDLHSVVAPVAGWGIEAIATSTVLHIPHRDLRALATSYPAIALAFWRDTTADASILGKWVSNVGRRNAPARTAHLVCEIGIRMEQAGLGERTRYTFAATQVQLADALGLTPVHVNRTLQALRADGLLRIEQRMVHVDDWDRLAVLAEFDPEYLLIEHLPEQRAA